MYRLKKEIEAEKLEEYGMKKLQNGDYAYDGNNEKRGGYKMRIIDKTGLIKLSSHTSDVEWIIYDLIKKDYIEFIRPDTKKEKIIKINTKIEELKNKLKELGEN